MKFRRLTTLASSDVRRSTPHPHLNSHPAIGSFARQRKAPDLWEIGRFSLIRARATALSHRGLDRLYFSSPPPLMVMSGVI